MRNIIVGTAGHIDHGKSALVRALTGTDPDRLEEEKRRGITIDLGFAHLQLTKDVRVGFIDVPGHERFVRNMLAGAAGIDLALFVVAADESVKPQTREHFEICRMLGVKAGVIALTKADLADEDMRELTKLEVAELVAGSFLEGAPQIPVSVVTNEGLDELRRALAAAGAAVREKSAAGWFRLPLDRAFTMRGFGAVATGTLVSGTVSVEDEAELHPIGRILRVRGVQVYGGSPRRARAGERTALNLTDIAHTEIRRGMTLATPGRFRSVKSFDCRLDLLRSARPLKNRAPVHLHIGSAEIEAEVRLLGKEELLQAGESAWARIALREPALALPDDRFIIRMFSPVSTIGGGVVVDISGRRYRKGDDFAARLDALLNGSPADRLQLLVSERPYGMDENEAIALTGLRELPKAPQIELAGKWLISASRVSQLRRELADTVKTFHRDHPLINGIPKQDLKGRTMPEASPEIFEHVLNGSADLVRHDEVVRLRTHQVVLKDDEERARTAIERAFEQAGLSAPAVTEVIGASGIEPNRARPILQMLMKEGKLVRITGDLTLHAAALKALREQLASRKGHKFSVTEFKEWTSVSRKYAIPLLEFLDRERVTRREGDVRVVL
jgi:selenocysteine-specific elongation factor